MLKPLAAALLGRKRLGALLGLWARWMRTGLPPGQIAQGLRQAAGRGPEAWVARDLQRAVEEGRPMVAGLKGWVPAAAWLALVSAAGTGGLGAQLARAAAELRRDGDGSGEAWGALLPGLVLVATAAAVLVAIVDARLSQMIAEISDPALLPARTRQLLQVSGHLAGHWGAWLLGLALPPALLAALAAWVPGALLPLLPWLPLMRHWHRQTCAQLLRSLALLAAPGTRSWSGAAASLAPDATPLQRLLLRSLRDSLAKGYTPGDCLSRLSGFSRSARWELRQSAGEADLAALAGQVAEEELRAVRASLKRAALAGRAFCSLLSGAALLLIFSGIWELSQSFSFSGAP